MRRQHGGNHHVIRRPGLPDTISGSAQQATGQLIAERADPILGQKGARAGERRRRPRMTHGHPDTRETAHGAI